jgi:hypothetical protein
MTTKRCCTCKAEKELGEFQRDSTRRDGLDPRCRVCTAIRIARYNAAHRAERRVYDLARTPESRYRDKKAWAEANREKVSQSIKLWQKRNAHRLRIVGRASTAVNRALIDGILVRPKSCELCKKECKPDAAHSDYSQPLMVRWLCRRCHNRWDKESPKTKSA